MTVRGLGEEPAAVNRDDDSEGDGCSLELVKAPNGKKS